MMVVEIQTVERVWRTYRVQVDEDDFMDAETGFADTEEIKVHAEEQVISGAVHKFTEGDAEIEEVIQVEVDA